VLRLGLLETTAEHRLIAGPQRRLRRSALRNRIDSSSSAADPVRTYVNNLTDCSEGIRTITGRVVAGLVPRTSLNCSSAN
jgi:hypothetical protein